MYKMDQTSTDNYIRSRVGILYNVHVYTYIMLRSDCRTRNNVVRENFKFPLPYTTSTRTSRSGFPL